MLYQGNYFTVSSSILVRDKLTVLMMKIKFQYVTDTDNELTEWINSNIGSMQSISYLPENSEPDSYDKNDVKTKVNDLVRLHKVMQERLETESYSEQIQVLTLVPDE